jgi:hypothetical protein
MDREEAKKEAAKRKRIAQEIAGRIHDIVEETLWDDYGKLPSLAEELVAACDRYRKNGV